MIKKSTHKIKCIKDIFSFKREEYYMLILEVDDSINYNVAIIYDDVNDAFEFYELSRADCFEMGSITDYIEAIDKNLHDLLFK